VETRDGTDTSPVGGCWWALELIHPRHWSLTTPKLQPGRARHQMCDHKTLYPSLLKINKVTWGNISPCQEWGAHLAGRCLRVFRWIGCAIGAAGSRWVAEISRIGISLTVAGWVEVM
jgi:hypothetical protein